MEEHQDIYQKPAPPQAPTEPLPSYDLTPDQVRGKTRRQIVLLTLIVLVAVVFATIYLLVSQSHLVKTDHLREALNLPVPERISPTNRIAVVPPSILPETPQLDFDAEGPVPRPPAGVSPEKMTAAMNHIRKGRDLLASGQRDLAEQEAQSALALWPDMTVALRMRGMIYIQRGQFDEAIHVLDRAIQQDPFNVEAYNNSAAAYMQKRNFDRAEELLQTSLEIRPGYAVSELNLGLLNILRGRYDDAIGFLTEALRKMPEHAGLLNNLAVCEIRLGRYDEARARLLERIQQGPVSPLAYFNLAITYAFEDNIDETLRWLGEAARRCPPTECLAYLEDADFDRVRLRPEFQAFARSLVPDLPVPPSTPDRL